ncbi:MAG TPA: hypothetical protein VIM65_04330 [Cyclobacteriaceae bacterium]
MREVTSIELLQHVKDQLLLDKDGRRLILIDVLNARHNVVRDLLVGYHYAEAGQVCNVTLKEDTVEFKNDLGGSFKVAYETHYFMACSDNRYDSHNSMLIEFKISLEKNSLLLSGEEIVERSPDSY